MLLKQEGHETQLAHNGVEAVAAAATFQPDLVLLDFGLPKLNGYEAARKIHEQPAGKDMMLVAVTAWGQEEDRRRSQGAGFDLHMVKPVDHPALMKLLASPPKARLPDDWETGTPTPCVRRSRTVGALKFLEALLELLTRVERHWLARLRRRKGMAEIGQCC